MASELGDLNELKKNEVNMNPFYFEARAGLIFCP